MRFLPLAIPVIGGMLFGSRPAHGSVSFNLIPDAGTPQYAVDAFNSAANLWSAVLDNHITVNISIGYSSLGPGILGSTSSNFGEVSYDTMKAALNGSATSADDLSAYTHLQSGSSYSRLINHTSDNPNGANSGTPYVDTMNRVGLTLANARALGLYYAADSTLDASIKFSSDFTFDFNRADGIASGQYDFVGMAAHEIGHVLGFLSGVDDIDYLQGAYPGDTFSSNLLDLFRFSALSLAEGEGVTDYTASAWDKYFSVDGGASVAALFSNGINYGDGRQASHWRDNLGIGIMDPTATTGELLTLSTTDLRAMDVLGYTLTPVPEPTTTALLGLGGLALLGICRRRH